MENSEAPGVKQREFNINIDQVLSKLTTSLSSLYLLLLSSKDKSCFPPVSGLVFCCSKLMMILSQICCVISQTRSDVGCLLLGKKFEIVVPKSISSRLFDI